MKKHVFLTTVVAVLAAPGVALSQNFSTNSFSVNDNSGNTMHGNRPNNGNFQGGGGPQSGDFQGVQGANGRQFQKHKAEMIQRITQRLSCVQAANDRQALEACMPKGGGRQGGGNGQRQGGGNGLREQH